MDDLVKDRKRFRVGVVYLVVVGLAICILAHNTHLLFYELPKTGGAFADIFRLLWSLLFGVFGFSVAAINSSYQTHEDHYKTTGIYDRASFYIKYPLHDGLPAIIGAILSYGILNAIPHTQPDHIFYILAAGISFYFGVVADIHMPLKISNAR